MMDISNELDGVVDQLDVGCSLLADTMKRIDISTTNHGYFTSFWKPTQFAHLVFMFHSTRVTNQQLPR